MSQKTPSPFTWDRSFFTSIINGAFWLCTYTFATLIGYISSYLKLIDIIFLSRYNRITEYFGYKREEIFSPAILFTIVSFIGTWSWLVPNHIYLKFYYYLIHITTRTFLRSALLYFLGGYLAGFLIGILDSRKNFPLDCINSFR